MKQLRLLTLGLAIFLLPAVPPTALAAPPHTGIQGQAFHYISYGAPIEVAPGIFIGNFDIQLPVATAFNVFSHSTGHEVGRVTTDADGSFGVSLHPGKYVLAPDTLTFDRFSF